MLRISMADIPKKKKILDTNRLASVTVMEVDKVGNKGILCTMLKVVNVNYDVFWVLVRLQVRFKKPKLRPSSGIFS